MKLSSGLFYLLAWPLMALTGILNGVIRVYGYGPHMSELAGHQVSTLIALLLFLGFVWVLTGIKVPSGRKEALGLGLMWLLLTVLFEFGFGHWVAGHSWETLLHDYDITSGRLWVLVPLWITVLPLLCMELRRRKS